MQSPEASGFARFGGFLLLVSLVLPYFALSFMGFGGVNFRLNTVDKGALVLVAAYGLLALTQVRFTTPQTMSLIYLIVGGLFTAALIYKIWISPPGSAPIGDLPVGGGKMTINGQETDLGNVTTNEVLKAFGAELKPTYGAYVAMVGSGFFTFGAFLEWRSGASRAPVAATEQPLPNHVIAQQRASMIPGAAPAPTQGYQQVGPPQTYVPPAQAAVGQPVPAQQAQPQPAQPVAQPQQGAVPARPPGC